MEAFGRFFKTFNGKSTPQKIESDEIYPVHMLDDTKTLRSIVVTWTLCFNDVLDANKLHNSLSELLNIGDWRKLGGRLRLKKDGQLEIHVPRPFTAERPAVAFVHQSHVMNIEDHPLAKTIPKATEGPSVQLGPQNFRAFAVMPNGPETLEDFTSTDAPQLSLFIISFNNATLVTLSWPHTLMDVMGQQALLRSWSLVLTGRVSEVPPLMGAREDPLREATRVLKEKQEDYSLVQKRLKGWAMARFGLRFATDMMWNRVVETHTIFLPKQTVAELCDQARNDLSIEEKPGSKPFISEGDVLTAWAMRAVACSLAEPRPVTALHALNARFRVSSLMQAPGVYTQNMAVAAFASIPADVSRGPLGHIALKNRQHLMEQSTEPQVLAYLRELEKEQASGCDPATMLYCEPDALLMPFTNWTRADFFNVADFSHALVGAAEKGQFRANPPGTMVFHHAQSMRPNPSARNVIVVLGKDHDGNYWLTGTLLPTTWAIIREELANM